MVMRRRTLLLTAVGLVTLGAAGLVLWQEHVLRMHAPHRPAPATANANVGLSITNEATDDFARLQALSEALRPDVGPADAKRLFGRMRAVLGGLTNRSGGTLVA